MTARSAYHLLAKPAGAACNLGCQYCFFRSKENLYPECESPLMPDDVLETHIRQLMESSVGPQVEVSWQGGEPNLVRKWRYADEIMSLQRPRPASPIDGLPCE